MTERPSDFHIYSQYFSSVSLPFSPVQKPLNLSPSHRSTNIFYISPYQYNTRLPWPVERVTGWLTVQLWGPWAQWYLGGWGYEESLGNNRKSVYWSEGTMCSRDYHSIMTARRLTIWTHSVEKAEYNEFAEKECWWKYKMWDECLYVSQRWKL